MEALFRASTTLLAEEEVQIGWGVFAYLGIVVLAIFLFIASARGGLKGRVFQKTTTKLAEQAYLFIENMCVSVIGPHGKKYMTFLMTIWLIIFFSNILGLLLPHSPMADWSLTFGLAVVVFCYVQYEGIRTNGLGGHFKHFAGPKLDGLALVLIITPLIFCIEFVSEWVKIISLSLRLYGNIFAGHQTKTTIDAQPFAASFPVIGEILLPLELLVAVVQAFVFVVLTAIYLSLVTHHEGEEHEHGDHSHETAHAAA
ncbi:MAG TPA: F0F1 ATP synthase subunit A [Fimbriimonas sp.]|nr:F0F1 ATP synthase subunit A [Fimbriimonas sp.]